jgi:hypothetical protein
VSGSTVTSSRRALVRLLRPNRGMRRIRRHPG